MAKKLLIADLLCGAGGSSTGAVQALLALGFTMQEILLVCLNHWPTAIETHRRNHPEARHYVQDIATVRPHLIVPEGYLDLLMASPTCTHHSIARGGKPTSDQQRSDPWHIITWLTELRVKRIIIENVWEFISWGPVDHRTGKPIKSRKGEYFHAWIETIKRLGFEPEWRKLNAADYGDATTRQRFILMARSDGRRVHWPMPTHQKRDELKAELFSAQPWRPAREIIDWTRKGKSIFNRKKPLAPKTLARIYAGALKFGWPEPFLILLRREMANSLAYHINWFFSVRNKPTKKAGRVKRRRVVREYIARLRHFRIAPAEAASGSRIDPLLITLRRNATGSSLDKPVPTLAANGQHVGIAEPVIVNMKGRSTASSSTEPLPTQTAHSPHLFSAEPIVLSQHNSGAARTTKDPLPTITTGGAAVEVRPGCARPILVEPFMLSRQGEGAPRSVEEPTPTQVAKHSHVLISPYYSNGWQTASGAQQPCYTADDPVPPITTKGRFGMVVPVTQSGGGAQARDTDQPIPTMTTAKGGEFALVMPVTHEGSGDRVQGTNQPLPTITGANRGELAFITAQHGERPGQPPRVHDISNPTPTIAATGHIDLVEPTISTDGYDILFRMLEPPELASAMGLEDYDFAGTKTEMIKQIGNAVSRRKMQACVTALMGDMAPRKSTKTTEEFREAAE